MEASKGVIETETNDDIAWRGDVLKAAEAFLDAVAESQVQKLLFAAQKVHKNIEVTLNSLLSESVRTRILRDEI